MSGEAQISFAAVILAAGASVRMGHPKMVLPWGASTVLGHIISEWTALGAAQIGVVCPPGKNAVMSELDRLKFPAADRIVNSRPEDGMFSSVQSAARWAGWNPAVTHWLIILGDQPQIGRGVLRLLLAHAGANPEKICQLSRSGRPRHPVALPRAAFNELATSTTANLREFLEVAPTARCLCDCEDDSMEFDLDEPADYERARGRFLPAIRAARDD